MKFQSILVSIFLLTTLAISQCFSQAVTIPRTASPAAVVTQTLGISTTTVNYSRPAVKGRKVWGQLVPYGWNVQGFGARNPAPWRAGANENTTITFSHEAIIEGTPVPAGIYGLFFVINQDNTGEVILSKNSRSWGSFFYDATHDQLRTKISVRDHEFVELLTYDFINLTKNTGDLVLNWEAKQFTVKIEFAVDKIVMENAKQELQGPVGFNAEGFISAAFYSFENNTDTEQGMKWIDHALGLEPTNFNALRVKSRLLIRMGKATEAEELMKNALANASENDITNYAYQLLGLGLHDKAIKVLVTNTERFPKSANAWDSLGEAYALKGDKPNAIKNFKKALTMNPSRATRENSEKYLHELGAM